MTVPALPKRKILIIKYGKIKLCLVDIALTAFSETIILSNSTQSQTNSDNFSNIISLVNQYVVGVTFAICFTREHVKSTSSRMNS